MRDQLRDKRARSAGAAERDKIDQLTTAALAAPGWAAAAELAAALREDMDACDRGLAIVEPQLSDGMIELVAVERDEMHRTIAHQRAAIARLEPHTPFTAL